MKYQDLKFEDIHYQRAETRIGNFICYIVKNMLENTYSIRLIVINNVYYLEPLTENQFFDLCNKRKEEQYEYIIINGAKS